MTDTIRLYVPGREMDLAIAHAWMRMDAAGDVDRTFARSGRSLSAFFTMIQPPRGMLFAWDASVGIWTMAWFEDFLGSPALGFWLDPSYRTRRGLLFWIEAVQYLFDHIDTPIIVGLTGQPKLLAEYQRLGHTIAGSMPLWDGEPAWMFYLTREAFAAVAQRYRRDPAAVAATNGRV